MVHGGTGRWTIARLLAGFTTASIPDGYVLDTPSLRLYRRSRENVELVRTHGPRRRGALAADRERAPTFPASRDRGHPAMLTILAQKNRFCDGVTRPNSRKIGP